MEIKATELRIGNWIKDHTGLNNVVKMIGVGWVKFIDDEACAFDLCSGIPLTEELLLKMGFEKLPHYTITNSLILKLSRGRMITVSSVGSPNLMVWIENVEGKDITDLVCIHNWDYDGELHVHTLQNIVWLLGKKELTLS